MKEGILTPTWLSKGRRKMGPEVRFGGIKKSLQDLGDNILVQMRQYSCPHCSPVLLHFSVEVGMLPRPQDSKAQQKPYVGVVAYLMNSHSWNSSVNNNDLSIWRRSKREPSTLSSFGWAPSGQLPRTNSKCALLTDLELSYIFPTLFDPSLYSDPAIGSWYKKKDNSALRSLLHRNLKAIHIQLIWWEREEPKLLDIGAQVSILPDPWRGRTANSTNGVWCLSEGAKSWGLWGSSLDWLAVVLWQHHLHVGVT